VTGIRRTGLATLAAGLLIVGAAQVAAPIAQPPLYDGVVPLEPYRWIAPPPDHPGGAEGATATVAVKGGRSELVAVATPEMSPQAQVFAVPGALTLPRGATSITVSITPLEPDTSPTDGYIDGNAYRILLTDQAGAAITAEPSQRVSIVLRPADPTLEDATIAQFDGVMWRAIETSPPSMTGGGFLAVVTSFGDFALVARGSSPYPSSTPSTATTPPATSPAPSSDIASSVPTPTPVSPPSAAAGSSATPGAPVVLAIAAVLVVVGTMAWVRSRRRRVPYRGAHRNRR
jgi:hypothetical protein